MIVCPGCGGRNEPTAGACVFCERRIAVPARTAHAENGPPKNADDGTESGAPARGQRRRGEMLTLVVVLILLLASILLYVFGAKTTAL